MTVGADCRRPDRIAGPVLSIIAAVCLAGLVAGVVFPHCAAIKNLAAGGGVLTLAWAFTAGCLPPLPDHRLRPLLLLYALAVAAAVVIPCLRQATGATDLLAGANSAWNTLRAMTGAGLALLLVRNRDGLRRFCAFGLLLCLALVLDGLASAFFLPGAGARLSGVKGNPNIYGMLLVLGMLPAWVLALERETGEEARSAWPLLCGSLLCVVSPLLLHRKQLYACLREGHRGLCLAMGLTAFTLTLFWVVFCRMPRWRQYLLAGFRQILVIAVVMSGSRTAMLTLGSWVLILWWFGYGYRRLGLEACILLLGVLLGYNRYAFSMWPAAGGGRGEAVVPRALPGGGGEARAALTAADAVVREALREKAAALSRSGSGYRMRAFIVRAGLRLFARHPLFGVGYGTTAFPRSWPYSPPYPRSLFPGWSERARRGIPTPIHAHNLWVHLLAVSGLVGFSAFMLLWYTAAAGLYRGLLGACAAAGPRRVLPAMLAGACAPGTAAVLVGLGALLMLQVNGLFDYPLMRDTEIFYWIAAGLGCAGLTLESAPAPRAG